MYIGCRCGWCQTKRPFFRLVMLICTKKLCRTGNNHRFNVNLWMTCVVKRKQPNNRMLLLAIVPVSKNSFLFVERPLSIMCVFECKTKLNFFDKSTKRNFVVCAGYFSHTWTNSNVAQYAAIARLTYFERNCSCFACFIIRYCMEADSPISMHCYWSSHWFFERNAIGLRTQHSREISARNSPYLFYDVSQQFIFDIRKLHILTVRLCECMHTVLFVWELLWPCAQTRGTIYTYMDNTTKYMWKLLPIPLKMPTHIHLCCSLRSRAEHTFRSKHKHTEV